MERNVLGKCRRKKNPEQLHQDSNHAAQILGHRYELLKPVRIMRKDLDGTLHIMLWLLWFVLLNPFSPQQ